METETLSTAFGRSFERRVLWLLLNDTDFNQLTSGYIESDHFDYLPYQIILEAYKEINDKHRNGDSPSIESIQAELIQRHAKIKENSPRKESLANSIEACAKLARIRKVRETDREYIIANIRKFIQIKRTKEALLQSVDLLSEGKVEGIPELLKEAVMSAGLSPDLGIRYSSVKTRLKRYVTESQTRIKSPTDIPLIDEVLDGGLYSKMLGVVVGPQGRGKTMALIHIGAAALVRGLNVIHITLELPEVNIAQRYDGRMTGIAINELSGKLDHYRTTIIKCTRKIAGNLYIKEWGSNEASTIDIRAYLKALERHWEVKPDIILVDYAALLRPVTKRKELRFELGDTARELRQLGKDYDAAVWTASQINKMGQQSDMPEMHHSAETSELMNVADLVLTFGQSIQEKRRGRMRWMIAKNRIGGHVGRVVDLVSQEDTQTFRQCKRQSQALEDIAISRERRAHSND